MTGMEKAKISRLLPRMPHRKPAELSPEEETALRQKRLAKIYRKMKRQSGKKKLNRSTAGNAVLFILMGICGVFMVLPLVMILNNAVKPLDELYQYPPRIFVRNPTLNNFTDLYVLLNESWVPFSRYILNTIIITVGGMTGHVIIASMAAYPLAKNHFPGKKILFSVVVLSMMFFVNNRSPSLQGAEIHKRFTENLTS